MRFAVFVTPVTWCLETAGTVAFSAAISIRFARIPNVPANAAAVVYNKKADLTSVKIRVATMWNPFARNAAAP